MKSHNMFDTDDGQAHRLFVLGKLNELMKKWVVQVSLEKVRGLEDDMVGVRGVYACRGVVLIVQGKSEEEAKEVGGKIFTFGSYRLGVHGKGKQPQAIM